MDNFEHFFKLFMMILDYILPNGIPDWVTMGTWVTLLQEIDYYESPL